MLGIETKSEDGRLRPAQIRVHAWLRASGALVVVPRSIEEVAAALVAEHGRADENSAETSAEDSTVGSPR